MTITIIITWPREESSPMLHAAYVQAALLSASLGDQELSSFRSKSSSSWCPINTLADSATFLYMYTPNTKDPGPEC